VPTRVIVGEERHVCRVSCGAAHTACICASFKLWVWGLGDGGRLGLGDDFSTKYIPVLVPSLQGERIAALSCGTSTTIVATEVSVR
jgi:E3 ubiquitin-protein ligase HERC2